MRPFKGKTNDGRWEESSCSLGTLFAGVVNEDFIPETVCRFTEMYDKNQKPIFEGDIVLTQPFKSKRGKERRLIGVVTYSVGVGHNFGGNKTKYYSAGWTLKFVNEEEASIFNTYDWGYFFDCEVIGNKFDNSELLGG